MVQYNAGSISELQSASAALMPGERGHYFSLELALKQHVGRERHLVSAPVPIPNRVIGRDWTVVYRIQTGSCPSARRH